MFCEISNRCSDGFQVCPFSFLLKKKNTRQILQNTVKRPPHLSFPYNPPSFSRNALFLSYSPTPQKHPSCSSSLDFYFQERENSAENQTLAIWRSLHFFSILIISHLSTNFSRDETYCFDINSRFHSRFSFMKHSKFRLFAIQKSQRRTKT